MDAALNSEPMTQDHYNKLIDTIQEAKKLSISPERKKELEVLIAYTADKIKQGKTPKLNFICTHNSRRSQFSQVWAKTAASTLGIEIQTFSGGIEETAFNERAVAALKRQGFQIETNSKTPNPHYFISFSKLEQPIDAFSKIYNEAPNPEEEFATVMVCDHADENCPIIPGAEKRIPLRYEDPKKYDETHLEETKYEERSTQIASEMFFVFSKVKEQIDKK